MTPTPAQPLPVPGCQPWMPAPAKPIPASTPLRVECEGMEEIEAAAEQTAKQPTPEPEQTPPRDPYKGLVWDAEQCCYADPGGKFFVIPDDGRELPF